MKKERRQFATGNLFEGQEQSNQSPILTQAPENSLTRAQKLLEQTQLLLQKKAPKIAQPPQQSQYDLNKTDIIKIPELNTKSTDDLDTNIDDHRIRQPIKDNQTFQDFQVIQQSSNQNQASFQNQSSFQQQEETIIIKQNLNQKQDDQQARQTFKDNSIFEDAQIKNSIQNDIVLQNQIPSQQQKETIITKQSFNQKKDEYKANQLFRDDQTFEKIKQQSSIQNDVILQNQIPIQQQQETSIIKQSSYQKRDENQARQAFEDNQFSEDQEIKKQSFIQNDVILQYQVPFQKFLKETYQQEIQQQKQIYPTNDLHQNITQTNSKEPFSNNDQNGQHALNQDFEFNFIIKTLNKQQREDHLRQSSKIWQQMGDKSQNNFFVSFLANIMQELLQCVDDHLLNDSMNYLRDQLIQQLELNLKQELIITYENLFNQEENWETILLLTLGFQQQEIIVAQQATLVDYLSKRAYKNSEEAIILLACTIMKMEASELKVTKLLQLYDTMLQNTSYTEFMILLLWLILKMYPKYLNTKNIQSFFHEFCTNINSEHDEAYFNSLLVFNAIGGGQMTLMLADRLQTFNHLGFLESQAIKFHKQLPGSFYHKLAQRCIEKQKQKAALEFLKHAIGLGCVESQVLREQLIQENQPRGKQVQQPHIMGGLFDSFKSVITKSIKVEQPPPLVQDKGQFYYDNVQKAWVINGQVAQEEEDTKQKQVEPELIAPPRTFLPPSKAQAPKIAEEKSSQAQQPILSIQVNPFSVQGEIVQDATRQKKSNLMRNRYVQ